MKITIGTNYFPSIAHAENYYMSYIAGNLKIKEANELVKYKIKKEEIKIGRPPIKENQELIVIDNRWHICE